MPPKLCPPDKGTVEDIKVHWEYDPMGYQSMDHLGDYTDKFTETVDRRHAIFDRHEGVMLGGWVDMSDAARQWWFRKFEKPKKRPVFRELRKVMRAYHKHDDFPGGRIERSSDIEWDVMAEIFHDQICREVLEFGVCKQTKHRILASKSVRPRRERDSCQCFRPSSNYNLKNGDDWAQGEEHDVKSFNQVSNWPPVPEPRERRFNGWRRYGIRPIIDERHPPGFWINVFYACEDHARMEALNEGEWSCMSIKASATVTMGGRSREIATHWVGGIESDGGMSYLKDQESEMLSELQDLIEKAGATWPEIPEPNITGDTPY